MMPSTRDDAFQVSVEEHVVDDPHPQWRQELFGEHLSPHAEARSAVQHRPPTAGIRRPEKILRQDLAGKKCNAAAQALRVCATKGTNLLPGLVGWTEATSSSACIGQSSVPQQPPPP